MTGAMSLRQSLLGRVFAALRDRVLLPWLLRAGVRPDSLTWAGLGLALLVPLAFLASPWLGLAAMLASGLADALDGALARATGQATRAGAFLDSTLDRAADFLYLAGLWLLQLTHGAAPIPSALLTFSAALLAFLVSYAKARGEALGAACDTGLMERAPRFLFLAALALAVALFPGAALAILGWGLGLFWVLTLATVAERMRRVRGQLQGEAKTEE
jgi:CDP-diacylglycerol--glycerol-3-phosphate 3-phosphatidyltransferase